MSRQSAAQLRRLAIGLFGSLAIGLGCSAPPMMSATQVSVSAHLVTAASASMAPSGLWSTVLDLEIAVASSSHGPDYRLEVYPYVGGAAPMVIDFGQGFDSAGRAIGGEGITIGSNGAAVQIAQRLLIDRGPNVDTHWAGEGVTLTPSLSRARVRFGIPATPAELAVRPDRLLVVVVCTERRASGDVHWSTTYPIPASLSTSGP